MKISHNHALLLAALLTSVAMPAQAQTADEPNDTRAPEPSPTPDTSPTQDPAQAPPPAEATQDDATLEDIVVTATRREERLQDIPVTVTAITAQSLSSADVTTVRSLTQVVPGFTGSRNMGVFQPVIRGVGSTGISIGDEPNIATYIDGIYQPESAANWIDLVEVERVEVLRGPQGTTFGRNATGGLINVITPDPSFDTRGKMAVRYGRMRLDANDVDLRAYVTGPLSEKFAMDFAGLFRHNDGYIKDLVRGGELGNQDIVNVRSKLLFRPSDRAKMILTGEYFYQNSTTNSPQPVNGNTIARNCAPPPPLTNPNCASAIVPDDAWEASLNKVPLLDLRRANAALRTQFEFGGFNLETASGYMDLAWKQETDSDTSNLFYGNFPATFDVRNFSQEVKLLSTGSGPLQWLAGVYYYWFDGSSTLDIQRSLNGVTPIATLNFDPELNGRSIAGFAEATYKLTPRFFVTLGGRYTTEKREFTQVFRADPPGPNPGVTTVPVDNAKKKFNKWTYRGALRYNFANDANVYLSYGTGFKSGVFNMAGTSPIPVEPETIKAWEGGIKADPLRWLRTNLSIFHYNYDDLQVQAKDANGVSYILQNAATAKIYGGEFEATIAPTRDLNIRASAAYLHARYTEFPLAQSFFPLANGGNVVVAADASGNVMTRSPKWTGNLGGEYGHDFGGGRLGVALNVFYSAKVFYDFQNNFEQKAYTLTNGSLSWTTLDKAWRFSLWGTNLTNEEVWQMMRPSALSNDGIYEQPRKIGIGIERKF